MPMPKLDIGIAHQFIEWLKAELSWGIRFPGSSQKHRRYDD